MTSPAEALEQYRSASQNWQDFRKERESTRAQLRDLLASADKPKDYPGQVDMLRERLAVLEWQINCTARDSLYTQRLVLDACVEDALEAFMTANGPALAGALAPCLNGAPTVKRTWYQCQNLECSCTFTALESVENIIMKPQKKPAQVEASTGRQPQTLGRYGSASRLSNRQQIPA
ncbi:phage polarity suppression protein [Enterobacillus tribolii]|nr:hypothetical protein [Enterobacillus tribolii]